MQVACNSIKQTNVIMKSSIQQRTVRGLAGNPGI